MFFSYQPDAASPRRKVVPSQRIRDSDSPSAAGLSICNAAPFGVLGSAAAAFRAAGPAA
jgi:hypothetical protein